LRRAETPVTREGMSAFLTRAYSKLGGECDTTPEMR
jgi:hypothetical protein